MGKYGGVWKYRVMGKYGGMEVSGAKMGVDDIGQGWNLFPLCRGYLQFMTNLNICLSMFILEYIISPNNSNVKSTGTSKCIMTALFSTYFTFVSVLNIFPL